MPGTLAYAAPTAVLPSNLCTSFVEPRAWPNVANDYADGNFQVRTDGANPRHSWNLSQRIPYATWAALKAFYNSVHLGPFYFYPNPANYDATGASTTGRYTVRFDGQFPSTYNMPRWDVSFSLLEIA